MIAIESDLVDEATPPFWEWVVWIVIIILIFEGYMRRGV